MRHCHGVASGVTFLFALAACDQPDPAWADGLVLEPTPSSVVGLRGMVQAELQGGDTWDFDTVVVTDPGLTFVFWRYDRFPVPSGERARGALVFEAPRAGTWGFTVETLDGKSHEGEITFELANAVRVDLTPWEPEATPDAGPVHRLEGVPVDLLLVDAANAPLWAWDDAEELGSAFVDGPVRFAHERVEGRSDVRLGGVTLSLPEVTTRSSSELSDAWTLEVTQDEAGVWLALEDDHDVPVRIREPRLATLWLVDEMYGGMGWGEPDVECQRFEADLSGPPVALTLCEGVVCTLEEVRGELDTVPCLEPEPLDEWPFCATAAGSRSAGWLLVGFLGWAARRRPRQPGTLGSSY